MRNILFLEMILWCVLKKGMSDYNKISWVFLNELFMTGDHNVKHL
jgi:hypothetical protein